MQGLCPSDDLLAALVDRVLIADESERVRSHIDECDACAEIVAAAVRGQTAPADLGPIGAKIGRYDVRGLLGAGGMGHVYEAYDAELDRPVALKVLRPDLAIAPALVDRLVLESRLMAKISHPSVITVHDIGRERDAVFIAMELIRGETLGAYVARTKPSWRTVVELFERAGAGLAAAHRAGVVHRDFKPDNVLVELDGAVPSRVIVTDFGVARVTSLVDVDAGGARSAADPRITQAGSLIGTPAYMAPEQLAGTRVDRSADVFAFCVSLWEALFGARPFRGTSAREIRRSMRRLPRPPHRAVPRALVRMLAKGLALDPRDRPQDISMLVRDLARLRARRWQVGVGAAIAGLIGIAVATPLLVADGGDAPCARETLRYDDKSLAAAIGDPAYRARTVTKVGKLAALWRETYAATCRADRRPAHPPRTAACLDARAAELVGVVDDLIRDRGAYAREQLALVGDPSACVDPAPGLLTARWPMDIALRRRVTALRHRAYAATATRDAGDVKRALAELDQLAREAGATWPIVHAEVLFMLGATQSAAGDTRRAPQTLRRAAAVAEAAHLDSIAASSWIQLVISATADEGAPTRGLEYATYAEAALERLGWPPAETSLLEFAKGATLTRLSRFQEAEASLRRAVALADAHALDTMPEASLGLGDLYEAQGRHMEAVDLYRKGLAALGPDDGSAAMGAIIFHQRLALNHVMVGDHREAERLARAAIGIAEERLDPDHIEHAISHTALAQVLHAGGRGHEAVHAIRTALQLVVKLEGERSALFGELMKIEADILATLRRFADSERRFERSCDILAFHHGDGSPAHAECLHSYALALRNGGKSGRARGVIDKAAPIILAAYDRPHLLVGNVLATRGMILIDLGQLDAGTADLERAVAALEKLEIDRGHLAGARFALAKALWPRDRARARMLLDTALATFEATSPAWARTRDEAVAFRAASTAKTRR